MKKSISAYTEISGVGVHSAKPVTVKVFHAEKGDGITFNNTSFPGVTIQACPENVQSVFLSTNLGCQNASVCTTEHLLAVLWALCITDIHFEMDSEEVPILDGSAKDFYNLLENFNTDNGNPPEYYSIREPIRVENGDSFLEAFPYDSFKVTFTIDFSPSIIGKQTFVFEHGKTDFKMEIAPARSFGHYNDLGALNKKGLALHSSMANALVVGKDNCYMNTPRFEDEAVRHKILDLIGDLYVLGRPLKGCFNAYKSSHSLNGEFVKKLIKLV